jgi:hypothetical protein
VFEVPCIYRVSVDRARLHRALIAEIDKQTRQTLRVLYRQQTTLLRAPDRARVLLARGIPTAVADLIPPGPAAASQ